MSDENKSSGGYEQKSYVPKAPVHDGDGLSYTPKAPTDAAPEQQPAPPPPPPSKG
jgi:hypothetical protein